MPVFANLVLDGFQQALRVLAFHMELECFFHGGTS